MIENSSFYDSKEEPNRGCLLSMRYLILSMDTAITETKKYGMPCFCFRKKMFCYLWVDKKTDWPYILFVEGQHLDHDMLETGDRKRMKILRIDPNQDLPKTLIEDLLNSALQLYRDGVVKIKTTSKNE